MEDPMYRDGTHIRATCDAYDVAGPLIGDHEDLDGIVTVRDELNDGKVTHINAWLWTVEIDEPPPPAG
jgi:hypothetical protein